MSDRIERFRIEKAEQWHEWCKRIPEIQFPRSWRIRLIPPFGGAMARFQVNDCVSIYLDVDNTLGFFSNDDGDPLPYWEIHPVDGDVWRVDMNDVDGLISAIKKSLRQAK